MGKKRNSISYNSGKLPVYNDASAVVGGEISVSSAQSNQLVINELIGTGILLRVGSSNVVRFAPDGYLQLGGTSKVIAPNTSDGSDNQSLSVAGGGTPSSTRGAYATLEGNELQGRLLLVGGAVSTGHILADLQHSSAEFQVRDTLGSAIIGVRTPGELYFNNAVTDYVIRLNTADGADNKSLNITSGGTWSRGVNNRGAVIELYGNEHATDPGGIRMFAGSGGGPVSITGSAVQLRTNGGNTQVSLINTGFRVDVGTDFTIHHNTTDGADNRTVAIAGGGAISSARGSYVKVHGNEHANTGLLQLVGGTVSGANIDLQWSNDANSVVFRNASSNVVWRFSGDGAGTNSLMEYGAGTGQILATTTTQKLLLGGGTGAASSLGAYIELRGNTHSSVPGRLYLETGSAGSAVLNVASTSQTYSLQINSTEVHVASATAQSFTIRDRPTGSQSDFSFAGRYADVTANTTLFQKIATITGNDAPIAAGIVDNGYRIGLSIESYFNTAAFQGTLAQQYGIWCRVGSDSANPTGTINNSYGIYIETLSGGTVTLDNAYGVYQATNFGGGLTGTKNYFEGRVGIGTNNPSTSHALDVAGSVQLQGNVVYTPSAFTIFANTSGGADNKNITIGGGGANSQTRGAIIELNGNEHGSTPGKLRLFTGAVAGASIDFWANGSLRWSINDSGSLVQDATNGADIVFNRNGQGTIRGGWDGATTSRVVQLLAGNAGSVLQGAILQLQTVAAGSNLRLIPGTNGSIQLADHNDALKWSVLGTNGDLIFHSTAGVIRGNTSDGSDNQSLNLTGAGSNDSTRGAQVNLYGNEHDTLGGVDVQTGNANGGNVSLIVNNPTGLIRHRFNGVDRWVWNDAGETIFNAAPALIKSSTSDGADTQYLVLAGGGDLLPGRGAYLALFGNDHPSGAGTIELYGGDATSNGNGHLNIGTRSTVGQIRLYTQSSLRWIFNPSGHFEPQDDSAYDIGTSASTRIRNLYAAGTLYADNLGSAGGIQICTMASSGSFREFRFNGTTNLITTNTSDGADNSELYLSAGGNASLTVPGVSRGAYILISGNEAENAGKITLQTGNTSAPLELIVTGNNSLNFYTNNTLRWSLANSSGALRAHTTQGAITQSTTDGNDTNRITIGGGGALDTGGSRGAEIHVVGNDAGGGVGGSLQLWTGNATSSFISKDINNAAGYELLRIAGVERQRITNTEVSLTFDGTNSKETNEGHVTSDGNAATAKSFTLADNTAYKFTVEIVGRLASTSVAKGVGGKLSFLVYRSNGGAATIAADLGGAVKELERWGSSTYDFDVDVSGNDVRLRVTGANAETVNWSLNIRHVYVG